MTYIKGFLLNLQFFTTIPIKKQLPLDKKYVRSAVKTFPLLGLVQGFLVMLALLGMQHFTPLSSLAISLIILFLTVFVSGAIHLDGWIDCSDAYFSFREQNRRLQIMADPQVGAFGVISLLFLLAFKFLFFYEIILMATSLTKYFFLLIPFLSKTVMGIVLMKLPLAKETGLAYFFRQKLGKFDFSFYGLIFILAIISLFLFNLRLGFIFLLLISISGLLFLLSQSFVKSAFGGITGDLVGGIVEGVELLLWLTVWLLHYYGMV